ncbi:hypothetical protein P9112_006613 [Eukaryota sp. TZLM1-RC]
MSREVSFGRRKRKVSSIKPALSVPSSLFTFHTQPLSPPSSPLPEVSKQFHDVQTTEETFVVDEDFLETLQNSSDRSFTTLDPMNQSDDVIGEEFAIEQPEKPPMPTTAQQFPQSIEEVKGKLLNIRNEYIINANSEAQTSFDSNDEDKLCQLLSQLEVKYSVLEDLFTQSQKLLLQFKRLIAFNYKRSALVNYCFNEYYLDLLKFIVNNRRQYRHCLNEISSNALENLLILQKFQSLGTSFKDSTQFKCSTKANELTSDLDDSIIGFNNLLNSFIETVRSSQQFGHEIEHLTLLFTEIVSPLFSLELIKLNWNPFIKLPNVVIEFFRVINNKDALDPLSKYFSLLFSSICLPLPMIEEVDGKVKAYSIEDELNVFSINFKAFRSKLVVEKVWSVFNCYLDHFDSVWNSCSSSFVLKILVIVPLVVLALSAICNFPSLISRCCSSIIDFISKDSGSSMFTKSIAKEVLPNFESLLSNTLTQFDKPLPSLGVVAKWISS